MTNEVVGEVAPEANAAAQQEKVIPQSLANKLIGEGKAEARAKGEAAGYAKAMEELAARNSEQTHSSNPVDKKAIEEIAENVLSKHTEALKQQAAQFQIQQERQKAAQEIERKVSEAEKRIPDFAKELQKVDNFKDAPGAVMLANEVDNSGDVLYELAKYPHKLASILGALGGGSIAVARAQIKALSESIKSNNQASGEKLPDEPLRQPQASNIGVGKAPSTAAEFAQQYKGRY